MNFDFSDEQKELKEQAHRFLSKNCGLNSVRRVSEESCSYDKLLWKKIGDLGWCKTAIPEQYGGLGLGYLELCVLAEELGQFLAPVPFDSTMFLFVEAITTFGSKEQKERLLPKIAGGELIGTIAFTEEAGSLSASGIRSTMVNRRLSGKKIAVYDGEIAHFAIVLAHDESQSGLSLAIVDLRANGVNVKRQMSINEARSYAQIEFQEVSVEPLGDSGLDGFDMAKTILERAAVPFAFAQIGGAQAAMEMAIDYSHKRYAFGRPIGSFQAVKHKLADMYVKNEIARSNAYFAAWALSTNADELPLAAASARVSATEAFDFAAKENIQIHGGIGFTWESDCHYFYKRSKELSLIIGSQRAWKSRLVEHLLASQGKPTLDGMSQ